jgi:hypothetical protein
MELADAFNAEIKVPNITELTAVEKVVHVRINLIMHKFLTIFS